MTTVALLVNPARADAVRLADETVAWLAARGHRSRVLVLDHAGQVRDGGGARDEDAAPDVDAPPDDRALNDDTVPGDTGGTDSIAVDLSGSELAVSLGGDGTFLRLAASAWAAGVPVLGVNFGRLGYLPEVQPHALFPALERTLAGDASVEERTALWVTVAAGGPTDASPGAGGPWLALNEVVLEKTVFGHTVRLAAAIDGDPFITYSADGLLVATPTGSTAYNLSAGGPVLSPRLQAMVVTPVAPHLSLDRSLVLHPDQVLTIGVMEGRPAALVIDGQEAGRLPPGSEVTCRIAPRPVRIYTLGERGLGGLLRITLALDRDR